MGSSDDVSFVQIDLSRLDKEWVDQPEHYFLAARDLASAKEVMAEAKANVDLVKAELGLAVRASPGDFDLEKATEGSVNDAITVHPRYKKAVARYIRAKKEVDDVEAAVTALEHKKKALESLVYLQGQNYFAEPRARGEDGERMREVEKTAVRKRGQKKARES
jgi:hypothetical protein